jgi:peptidoglycan/xylan/chitin deacetylase (PgdA/CDA1 family)
VLATLYTLVVACSEPAASPVVETTTSTSTGVTATVAAAAPPATTTTTTTAVAPHSTAPAVVVSRGNPNRRMVALTFDAGSDTGFTAAILDTLAASQIPATFGLTGKWADENRDLVRRIGAGGHQVVNHTWDHRSFTGASATPAVVSTGERHTQLERTEAVLLSLTGRTTRPWFRPPYGDYDRSVNADVGAAGYNVNVLWTVDSLGWQGLSAAAITARCLRGAEPGTIYLFHVGAASQDAAALPGIISGLRGQGYGFGTVAEVIAG